MTALLEWALILNAVLLVLLLWQTWRNLCQFDELTRTRVRLLCLEKLLELDSDAVRAVVNRTNEARDDRRNPTCSN